MSRLHPKPIESERLEVVSGHQYFEIVYQLIPMCRNLRNTVLEASKAIRKVFLIQPGSVTETCPEKLVLNR